MQVEVPCPIGLVWDLWSDLERMPDWMLWIKSVQVLTDDPDLSQWQLALGVWNFSWRSRILRLIKHQLIRFESVDGLPNRGAIHFYDRGHSSIVKLTIAYAIPGPLGQIMDALFLGSLVEKTLQADLYRFREYAGKFRASLDTLPRS